MIGHIVLDVIGASLMIFATLHVWLKVPIWIDAGRNASGGAPELDGLIFPPLFFTFGLFSIVRSHAVPLWGYLLLWATLTAILYGVMAWMHKAGGTMP